MPDFENLKRTLLSQGEGKRVPQFEISIDLSIKETFLGRPVKTVKDDVDFYMQAGYDHVPMIIGLRESMRGNAAGIVGAESEQPNVLKAAEAQYNPFNEESVTRMWAEQGEGVITDTASFDNFAWPDADGFGFDAVDTLGQLVPAEAKVLALIGGVFTCSWMLMGLESFCIAAAEGSDLVTKLIDKIGQTQYQVVKNVLEYDCVGAVCMPDDLGYTTGLMVSPKLLREYVFPWNKRIGELVRAKGIPYIYHSDGRIYDVHDDLIECGFNAIHPCEPASTDIVAVSRKYAGKLCVLGNIDLDSTLTLGTPEEVRAEVKERIRTVAPGGGYCCGSSNSVPEYVPYENYVAMIQAVRDFGEYPLKV